jgi:hypothetical protein
MQDKVIFKLSTYLPLFHALDSLNFSHCASQLSIYLCMKNFEFQFCSGREECPGDIVKTSRQTCLYFVNTSSPCSLSGINTTLQNAGYNIPVSLTDFDCSTLPIEQGEKGQGTLVPLVPLEELSK